MGKIRHIAITAEDPFVTAELFKKALGLEELSRGDSELAREVYLTDGYLNIAIVCWKRTKETPNPYPDGYGLDHFGVHVDDLASAEAARAQGRRHVPAAAAGRPLQARRQHALFREEARARRREVRSFGARLGDEKRIDADGKIALEASGVRKIYKKDGREMPVLDVDSFVAREGEFITIIGPSGCGKSTFLHIMGGFIPAEAGTIRVYGNAVNGPGPDRGMMFQEFALFPWKTVAGNVAWGLEAQGTPRAQIDAIVQKYLEIMGLAEFRNHYPAEISGGMKQRAALARVLAFDPKVLLMDEPFGALDAQTRETMQEELTRLWERTGKTIVFVTHDIEEAVYLGDRVVVLSARPGRIREEVRIDLPRPRGLEIKKSAQCHEYRNLIWDLVRQGVTNKRRGNESD